MDSIFLSSRSILRGKLEFAGKISMTEPLIAYSDRSDTISDAL